MRFKPKQAHLDGVKGSSCRTEQTTPEILALMSLVLCL